jgi:hypothetical protein
MKTSAKTIATMTTNQIDEGGGLRLARRDFLSQPVGLLGRLGNYPLRLMREPSREPIAATGQNSSKSPKTAGHAGFGAHNSSSEQPTQVAVLQVF